MQSSFGGITGVIMPTWQYQKHSVSLRYSNTVEPLMDGPKPDRYLNETSILYGRCKKGHFYYYALSAGPGFIQGVKRGELIDPPLKYDAYEKKTFATFGLSVNAQTSLITPYFGLGLNVCCHLNSVQPIWSILLGLHVGHLLDF